MKIHKRTTRKFSGWQNIIILKNSKEKGVQPGQIVAQYYALKLKRGIELLHRKSGIFFSFSFYFFYYLALEFRQISSSLTYTLTLIISLSPLIEIEPAVLLYILYVHLGLLLVVGISVIVFAT